MHTHTDWKHLKYAMFSFKYELLHMQQQRFFSKRFFSNTISKDSNTLAMT